MILLGYLILDIRPIVIYMFQKPDTYYFMGEDLYNPIENFDFSKDNNEVIMYTSFDELQYLPNVMKKSTLLYNNDNNVIQFIKENFYFERISEDFVETTDSESFIIFKKEGKILFKSNIQIENGVISLKFENTGWTFSTNSDELIYCFSQLKRYYIPFIVF